MTTGLVQCHHCGERHYSHEPVMCCSEMHCFPVSPDTLDAEWREYDDGLRTAAEEARFQQMREEDGA